MHTFNFVTKKYALNLSLTICTPPHKTLVMKNRTETLFHTKTASKEKRNVKIITIIMNEKKAVLTKNMCNTRETTTATTKTATTTTKKKTKIK